MKTTNTKLTILTLLVILFISCKKNKKQDPIPQAPLPPTNESELITTMKVTLYDTTTHVSNTYIFSDIDGAGGNPAVFGGVNQSDSVITILSNHVYKCSLLLLDQSKNPVDTTSNEVAKEGVDHLFFFNSINPTGSPYSIYLQNNLTTIKYLDLDANNKGIGLHTLWTAPNTSTNKWPLIIELKHQPNIKDGTYAPGETDIQVAFKLKVN